MLISYTMEALEDESILYDTISPNTTWLYSSSQQVPEYNCSALNLDSNLSNLTDVVLSSNMFPSELAVPLYGYALPIILVLTTFANLVIVAILKQKNMRTPTNVLLIAISLSDLFTLVIPAPIFLYMYTLGYYVYPLYPISLCYGWSFTGEIIPNLFHTASIWLTVGLAMQRYIYVCHAHFAVVWCTISRVKKYITWVFVAAFVHQFMRFIEQYYVSVCVFIDDNLLPACKPVHISAVHHNQDFYFGTYFWFRVFFVHLGPCTLLVILNSLLFRALWSAQKRRDQLLRERRKKESRKLRDANVTTMMLIIIVGVFLITEIPLAVITLLHLLTSLRIVEVFSPTHYDFVRRFFIISNFFIILFYPINFAIYCGMSKQFRDSFCNLFSFKYRQIPKGREETSKFSVENDLKETTMGL